MPKKEKEDEKADTTEVVRDIEDAVTYPILTEQVSFPGAVTPGAPAAPGLAPLGQVVESTMRDVLGWRAKVGDTKGFVAALSRSFATRRTPLAPVEVSNGCSSTI